MCDVKSKSLICNFNFQIASQQSVAKVNVVGPSRNIEKDSVISKSFVRAGGPGLVRVS